MHIVKVMITSKPATEVLENSKRQIQAGTGERKHINTEEMKKQNKK
jgi:hypothetical protein